MNKITTLITIYDNLETSMHEDIIQQLVLLNKNVSNLTEVIGNQSFWNSQLFAAILGASSAILVLLIQSILKWRKGRSQRLEKIYLWAAEQIDFHSPEQLFASARNTSFASVTKNKDAEMIRKTPEKPIGEKMVINLKDHVKYWKFPNSKIKRLFTKYEKSLLDFNSVDDGAEKTDYENQFSASNTIFQQIKDLAFKVTGENEWTC